ncbi:hypothetical protein Oweho_3198 [Owenweeksia hongkongensis DSM 17368]|uniref:Uncharacterized protein n=1 Tax=Owenweeksia hongkongensis (strain DSM 17368 / CIP 108786 / JCM 12287 / NRRL B-23963 / UST20020801) TaxID=926562 RepID=G8R3R2_OWEHD|nr:hypothetical protein [Owenweeksia hongkongensis]AEV34149.1 hypothetical protein Oweho_3198 [Owenweeksia hongkongensis DSM 17368]
MHKIEIPEAKLSIDFPENIYELKASQYHYYIQLVVMMSKGHISLVEFKVMWVYHLMNMKYTGKVSDEKMMALAQIMDLTEGFFTSHKQKDGSLAVSPITDCAINHCKSFHYNGRTYYGPADAIADLTIGQFLDGLSLANAYAQEQDIKYLQQLFVLMHKVRARGSRKSKPITTTLVNTLQEYHIYGFFFFFQSALEFITTQDVHLADGRVYNFSPLFSGGNSGESVGPVAVLFDLAQSGLFGTIDKTKETLMMDSLIYLLDSHFKAKRATKKT